MKVKLFLSIVAAFVIIAFTTNATFAQAQSKMAEKPKTEKVKPAKEETVKPAAEPKKEVKEERVAVEKKVAHHKMHKKGKAEPINTSK